jgi:hypothetical protein
MPLPIFTTASSAIVPPRRCDAEALRQDLVRTNNELGFIREQVTQMSAQLRSPRTTPAQRNELIPQAQTLLARYTVLEQQARSLGVAIARCAPLNRPAVPRALGATFPLEAYDGALLHLQQQLVRLGFLGEATGKWDWATYAACGFATRYLGAPWHDTIHAATNSIDINDDWIAALERATPAPAGTIGLWSAIPHASSVPWKAIGIGAGVVAAGYIGYRLWKRK